jgi:FMN-dependent NADH-azoreductase
LKAWFDRIAQAGKTFKYTENGPVGLYGAKRVILASARGGVYSTNPAMAGLNLGESYVKAIMGFMGITDVTVVRAEGVSMGPAVRDAAVAATAQEIAKL